MSWNNLNDSVTPWPIHGGCGEQVSEAVLKTIQITLSGLKVEQSSTGDIVSALQNIKPRQGDIYEHVQKVVMTEINDKVKDLKVNKSSVNDIIRSLQNIKPVLLFLLTIFSGLSSMAEPVEPLYQQFGDVPGDVLVMTNIDKWASNVEKKGDGVSIINKEYFGGNVCVSISGFDEATENSVLIKGTDGTVKWESNIVKGTNGVVSLPGNRLGIENFESTATNFLSTVENNKNWALLARQYDATNGIYTIKPIGIDKLYNFASGTFATSNKTVALKGLGSAAPGSILIKGVDGTLTWLAPTNSGAIVVSQPGSDNKVAYSLPPGSGMYYGTPLQENALLRAGNDAQYYAGWQELPKYKLEGEGDIDIPEPQGSLIFTVKLAQSGVGYGSYISGVNSEGNFIYDDLYVSVTNCFLTQGGLDIVTNELDHKYVDKTGDTMDGDLGVKGETSAGEVTVTSGLTFPGEGLGTGVSLMNYNGKLHCTGSLEAEQFEGKELITDGNISAEKVIADKVCINQGGYLSIGEVDLMEIAGVMYCTGPFKCSSIVGDVTTLDGSVECGSLSAETVSAKNTIILPNAAGDVILHNDNGKLSTSSNVKANKCEAETLEVKQKLSSETLETDDLTVGGTMSAGELETPIIKLGNSSGFAIMEYQNGSLVIHNNVNIEGIVNANSIKVDSDVKCNLAEVKKSIKMGSATISKGESGLKITPSLSVSEDVTADSITANNIEVSNNLTSPKVETQHIKVTGLAKLPEDTTVNNRHIVLPNKTGTTMTMQWDDSRKRLCLCVDGVNHYFSAK